MRKSYCRSSLSVKNPGDSPAVEPVGKVTGKAEPTKISQEVVFFLQSSLTVVRRDMNKHPHTEDNVNSVHKEDFK